MRNNWLAVPLYKQELPYSCLAAAVRMVIAFSGHTTSEELLRHLLGTKLSGTSARNLLSVEALGFDVQLGFSNKSELLDTIGSGLPVIAFVNTGPLEYWKIDCAHVVVVVGMTEEAVVVNDPWFDTAPQQTSLQSFLDAWAMNSHLAAIIRPRSRSAA